MKTSDDLFDTLPWTPLAVQNWSLVYDYYKHDIWHRVYENGNKCCTIIYIDGDETDGGSFYTVSYHIKVDEEIVIHRYGGPACYIYNIRTRKCETLSFYINGKKYSERQYWFRMLELSKAYAVGEEGDVIASHEIPHPLWVGRRTMRYAIEVKRVKLARFLPFTKGKYYALMEERFDCIKPSHYLPV